MAEIGAGELNRRVKIRKQTDIPAMGAAITQNFDAGIDAWAKIEPVGNAIFFGTKQVGENVTHRIIVRRQVTVNEQLITGDHVVDHTMDSVTSRYRVRRASDLNGARRYLMLEVELLGNV